MEPKILLKLYCEKDPEYMKEILQEWYDEQDHFDTSKEAEGKQTLAQELIGQIDNKNE